MSAYIRTTFDKSKCVDLPFNDSKNGNQLQLYDCNNSDAQNFLYSPNTLEIKHLPSNKCVDLNANIHDNGNTIQLWDCHGGDNQKWKHDGNLIKLNNTNKCIDVPWGDLKSGNKLQLWDCNNTLAQQFDLLTKTDSFSTQCKKDEDFNSVWGSGGKTAKLKAMKECSDKGYYNNTINDCGGWNFSATCKDLVPSNWSSPYSDEHAREIGKYNRDHAINDDCKSKGYMGYSGEWKEVGNFFNYSGKCDNPKFKGVWEKISCVNGILTLRNQVEAYNFGWDESADYLLKSLGDTFDNKKIIKKWKEKDPITGQYIKIDLEDMSCSNDNTPLITGNAPSCNFSKNGEFGDFNPVINNALTKDSVFVLEAINWISGKEDKKTFLRGDGNSIKTDDDVQITGNDLNRMYHFKLELDKCNQHSYITYGAKLQLKNVGTNKFIQCAAGTCSGVDKSGDCLNESWQTFKIISASGKKDGEPVCYGDDVYFVQTVNMTAAITPAGDGHVWAVDIGNNQNSILRILPVKGSLYNSAESILKEISNYNKTRLDELCKRDPANVKCTEKNLKEAGNELKKNIIIFSIIAIIILVLVLLIKIL